MGRKFHFLNITSILPWKFCAFLSYRYRVYSLDFSFCPLKFDIGIREDRETYIYTQRLTLFKDHLHKKFVLFIVETRTTFSRYPIECKSIRKFRNCPFSLNSLKYFPAARICHRGASVNVPLLVNTLFSSHLRR